MVTISRTIPGIGDAIMMEPTIRELSLYQKVTVITQYPDLFEGTYSVVDNIPPGSKVIDLGHDGYCPCASYELEHIDDIIQKGRIEIFLDQVGLTYLRQCPSLKLSNSEIAAVDAARSGLSRPSIGLSLLASNYKDPLDGWRNYPYHKALIKQLGQWADITWLHTSSPPLADVAWEPWSIREIMVIIASLDAVIAIDSGPAHLAGALGVSLFGLFGPTDPNLRIGVYPQTNVIPMYTKCGRAYCWYQPCKGRYCLTTLSPRWIAKWVKSKLLSSINVGIPMSSGFVPRKLAITE